MTLRYLLRTQLTVRLTSMLLLVIVPLTLFQWSPTHAQGTFIAASNRVDMVYDGARGVVYITNGASVLRYHLASETFLPPFELGGTLRGIDLSPDGNTLAIADGQRSDAQVWIHLVDLNTEQSRKVSFPRDFYEGGTFSVAYGSDGAILISSTFEGSGWVPLRRYDPATETTTTLASIRQDSMLTASADGTTIAFEESNISDGAWGVYKVTTGSIVRRSGYTDGTSWFNYEIGVNRTGTQYALPTYGGAYIYNAAYQRVAVVGDYAGQQPIGVVYHPTRDLVYFAWAGTTQVRAHDTTSFTQVAAYDVGYTFGNTGNYAFTQGRLKIARDGSLLLVTVGGGIRVVLLTPNATTPSTTPSATPTTTPSATPSTTPTATATAIPPSATPTSDSDEYAITINNGALYTNRARVTLSLRARPGTAAMQISNDGGFGGAVWEPYAPTKIWQITRYWNYVIPRIVYVRFKDSNGVVWGSYQDDILLDETPPHGHGRVVLSENGHPAAEVRLALDATDDVSGVGEMRLSNQPDFAYAAWEPYATSKDWILDDTNAIYIQFRDNAGNSSATYTIRIWKISAPLILAQPSDASGR